MSAETQTKKFNEFTLSECAKFDHDNGLKDKLTGWGIICHDRAERNISRAVHVASGEGKRGGKVQKAA